MSAIARFRRWCSALICASLLAGACGGGGGADPSFESLCIAAQNAFDALSAAPDPTDPAVADAFAAVGQAAPPVAGSEARSADQVAFGLEQLYYSYVSVHQWRTADVDGPAGDIFGAADGVADAVTTLATLDEQCSRVDADGFVWRGTESAPPLPTGPVQLVRFLGVRMLCTGDPPARCEPDPDESADHRAVGQVWCSGVGASFACAPFDAERYFGVVIDGANHVCGDPGGGATAPSGDYRCLEWAGGAPPDPLESGAAVISCDGRPDDGTGDADPVSWPPRVC